MFYIEGGDGQNFSFVRTFEGWMDGWMDGRKDEWMEGRTHISTYRGGAHLKIEKFTRVYS